MRDTIEPRTQYDNWRERHAEALRRPQSEQAARVAAAEQNRARSEGLYRQAVGESMRKAAQKQEQLKAQEQNVARVRYFLDESSSNLNWLQKERDREDRELSGVKLQTAQEVQNTGDGCVGGRAAQRGHHLPAARFAEHDVGERPTEASEGARRVETKERSRRGRK